MWLQLVFIFVMVASLFGFAFASLDYRWNWQGIWAYREKYFRGWLMTLVLSAGAMIMSGCIGVVLVGLQRVPVAAVRIFVRFAVELVRGTPLLVQIFILYYIVADAFGVENRYLLGGLILSLFSGAYVSEILRGGIESVGETQYEAGRSVGFTEGQIYRYVVIPQALQRVLPSLAGQFVSLVKDSSLLSVIAIGELTLNAQEVNSFSFSPFESFIPLAFGYLVLTLPIAMWSRRLERHFEFDS